MTAVEPMQSPRPAHLAREINAAFDDPAPDIPAEQVFEQLEQQYAADTAAPLHGAEDWR